MNPMTIDIESASREQLRGDTTLLAVALAATFGIAVGMQLLIAHDPPVSQGLLLAVSTVFVIQIFLMVLGSILIVRIYFDYKKLSPPSQHYVSSQQCAVFAVLAAACSVATATAAWLSAVSVAPFVVCSCLTLMSALGLWRSWTITRQYARSRGR